MARKHISLIGVNHKSTPLEIREKVALTGGYEEALTRLKGEKPLEYYLLSTCNRVELIWVSEDVEESTSRMLRFLFGNGNTGDQKTVVNQIITGQLRLYDFR